ncbi:MAG: DUF5723 family protein [Bacteroidia bacterium]
MNARAQFDTLYINRTNDSIKASIGFYGNYDYNSNAITNRFLGTFLKNGFLDNSMKDAVSNRLQSTNRFGGDVQEGAYYTFYSKKKEEKFFVAFKNCLHFDTQFSPDLFNVAFYGNQQYQGKTANFDNFNLNLLQYQQVEFGIVKKIFFSEDTTNKAVFYGASIAILNGQQYTSITAKTAQLYTDINDQYINFNTSVMMNQSDTARKKFGSVNGIGAALNLFIYMPYITYKHKGSITIHVTNIGAIEWNKNASTYQQDSLFHYEGFQINNIYDLKNATFAAAQQDSVLKKLTTLKKQAYSTTLPATLDVSSTTNYGKFQFTKGFNYIFNANYTMCYFIGGNYFFNPNFCLTTRISYGGYGFMSYGLGIVAKLKHNFTLTFASNDIEGFILPNSTTGGEMQVKLVKYFN